MEKTQNVSSINARSVERERERSLIETAAVVSNSLVSSAIARDEELSVDIIIAAEDLDDKECQTVSIWKFERKHFDPDEILVSLTQITEVAHPLCDRNIQDKGKLEQFSSARFWWHQPSVYCCNTHNGCRICHKFGSAVLFWNGQIRFASTDASSASLQKSSVCCFDRHFQQYRSSTLDGQRIEYIQVDETRWNGHVFSQDSAVRSLLYQSF